MWLACDEHREHLEQFLGTRAFLRSTVPVAELDVAGASGQVDAGGTGSVGSGGTESAS